MKKILSTLLLVAAQAGTAFAEEAAKGHHAHPEIGELFWHYINFFIFVVILVAVIRRPFREAWAARRNQLESEVNRSADELKVAETQLKEAQQRAARVEADARELTTSIMSSADLEGAQIIEDAKRRADFIARQTEDSITAESRHAEMILRRQIGQKVLDKATQLLKQELSPEADRELRRGVVDGVRRLAEELR